MFGEVMYTNSRKEKTDVNNQRKSIYSAVFYRTSGSERLLVVHNVSEKQSTHTVKHAIKAPIADMNNVKIESKSATEHVLTMPAYSSIIIEL